MCDVAYGGGKLWQVTEDGAWFVCTWQDHSDLYFVSLTGEKKRLTGAEGTVNNFHVAQGCIYFTAMQGMDHQELFFLDRQTGDTRCISDFNKTRYANKIIQPMEKHSWTDSYGFEIYGSHEQIREAWDKLMASGECKPCGLGCRDTLRFEVGLPLYGDELSADISPIMAGLGFFCKLDKEEFIGRDALIKQKAEGVARKLVGIELSDKAIPRHGYAVVKDGETVGEVTTGYHTISTDKSVCMALVDSQYAKLGTELEIKIRKKTFPGVVVKKKFYEKHYKK